MRISVIFFEKGVNCAQIRCTFNLILGYFPGTVNGVEIERIYVGTFMTSLEMAGVSITLLHLNEERKNYLGNSVVIHYLEKI